ncbi:F-box/FBD/LRR-repeat protein At1g13570-like [Rhododendron vialii]|uniref:F-box/FBD/LRR-repeat protein At1g13570-like n=1 Tax=Rhododendron vialii TaxID=182163 RepID=UPI00265D92A1|nr:F-box/FBD/LRR-repeat protein At1g13570-like [Rhododendron vialii]XP_058193482.1 F-box/FBD/LRR-repeat protein At1g13570-like [Rhododendron vialii]
METGGLVSTQKRREMGGSTSDIISNLPRNLLEEILVCLTIQDAVRTSVLSRKWRYIWTTLPKLVFDDNFCRGSVMRARSDKLMMTIYKVLLLHHGPILKFTLSLSNLESCPEINQLTLFVSNKGIREFTLYVWKGELYRLPCTLFSCLQLEHLNLSWCVFKPPPSFKGFTMLLSLELYEVVIAGDVLSSLVSGCPLLERLTFSSFNSFDYLEIVAFKLKYFSCEGLFRSICVRMPHVADATVVMKGSRNQLAFNEGKISNSVMLLLCSIPMVEFLVLDYPYVKCMAARGVQERLPNT